MKNRLYIVAGPTAVGKTKYAIELAKRINGEIVSLDSVQVYKFLDIGSAKPTKEELLEVPHYMIDEVEPSINLNVKEFKDRANVYIEDIIKKSKIPILVGGSGFYIRAVLYDTDFLEEDEKESAKVRKELYDILDEKGIDYLYDELKKVDLESTIKIAKENTKRVIRALEFYKLHNIPISSHNMLEREKESKYDYKFYVLDMDREKLYNRINVRVDKMIEDGLLKEIKNLINMGLSKDLNSMKSIGYKELYDFVANREIINDVSALDTDSKIELNRIVDYIKQQSRNYAKKQLTWFRSERNVEWIKV